MSQNKHLIRYATSLAGTGKVWVATWNEDGYYNEDTPTAERWNKEFKTIPCRVSTRDMMAATTEYAKSVAAELGCDVLERK